MKLSVIVYITMSKLNQNTVATLCKYDVFKSQPFGPLHFKQHVQNDSQKVYALFGIK